MRLTELAGQRVAVWGLGAEGRAVIDAMNRAGVSANCMVVDEAEDGPASYCDVDIHRGAAGLERLRDADVVIKSPTISRYRPLVAELATSGVTLTTATELFFAEQLTNVIGITGTKGKTTAATLIARFLEATGATVELTGNIGTPPVERLGITTPDWWVVELSSYQTSSMQHSPAIGVLTSLAAEHLDWHGDENTYRADKLNLFAHDTTATVILNWADPGVVQHAGSIAAQISEANVEAGAHVSQDQFYFGPHPLFDTDRCHLLGQHNLHLVCVALQAVTAAGIDIVKQRHVLAAALDDFQPVDHRLQVITTRDGITYVDDSISTTPESTVAGLEAFAPRAVTVIVGGYDRGLSYERLADYVVANHHRLKVVAVPDSHQRIIDAIDSAAQRVGVDLGDTLHSAADFVKGVELAERLCTADSVLLLSPGAPSFGHFRDYKARAAAFRSALSLP